MSGASTQTSGAPAGQESLDSGQPPSLGVPTFPAILGAEVAKLSARISFRVAVVLLLLVGLVVPILLLLGQVALARAASDANPDAVPPEATLAFCLFTVRQVRSFFLAKALIVWLVAESVAGEFTGRTLREDLVRPVHRSTVLGAKWLSVQTFVAIATLVPLTLGAGLGLAFFGLGDGATNELREWGLAWLGDAGFAAVVVLVAVVLRSVPGTIVGVILGWIFVFAAGAFLWGLEMARPFLGDYLARVNAQAALAAVDLAIGVRPWLPSAAFALNGAITADAPVIWESFAALGLYTVGAYLIADRLFARLDID